MKKHTFTAFAIAVAAWTVGACVYVMAEPAPDDPLDEYDHSKKYEHDVQAVGGKGALVTSQLSDSLAGLFQGSELGITIGVAGTLGALVYLRAMREA